MSLPLFIPFPFCVKRKAAVGNSGPFLFQRLSTGKTQRAPTKPERARACLGLALPLLLPILIQTSRKCTHNTLTDSNGQALPVFVPFLAAPWCRCPPFFHAVPGHVGAATTGCQPCLPSFPGKSNALVIFLRKDRTWLSGLACLCVCGHGILTPETNVPAGICTALGPRAQIFMNAIQTT